jgi:hypothetical protein
MDPYAPVVNTDDAFEPLTPALLFQKLAALKQERERLKRSAQHQQHITSLPSPVSAQSPTLDGDMGNNTGLSLSDELARVSLTPPSDAEMMPAFTSTTLNDRAGLACLDPFYAGEDVYGQSHPDSPDDRLNGALAAMTQEAAQALVTTVDTFAEELDAEFAAGLHPDSGALLLRDGEHEEDAENDEEEYDDDEEDDFYGLIPHGMPPEPGPDAPLAEQVYWQVTCAVHRALDTITLDLPQMLENSRIGGAAMQLSRIPSAASETMIGRAVRSQLDSIVHGRLVRNVQQKYSYARYLVVSTVERDVRDVLDCTEMLHDDVNVIGAHLDAIQARLETLVVEKIQLITDAITLYVREIIPREFTRLLQTIMFNEGAMLHSVYTRVHDQLLPFIQQFVSLIVVVLERHAEWLNTMVVRKVSNDLLTIRQRFTD